MPSHSNRLLLFSIANSLYQAARMFCSSINQLYLVSLGFDVSEILKLYAFHSFMLSLVNLPVSFYADAFSKKKIVFLGLGCVCLNYFLLWSVAPLSHGSWRGYCAWIVYSTEIIYTLGREMIDSALDAWFVSDLSDHEREVVFPQYTHMTRSYTPVLSMISALIGIGLSYWGEFSFCYLLSFFSLLAVVGLFCFIARDQSSHPSPAYRTSKPSQVDSLQSKEKPIFSKLRETAYSYRSIFASTAGLLAIASFIAFFFARWITFHLWQVALLGPSVKKGVTLSKSALGPLMALTIAMYMGQYLSNKLLKKQRPFSTSYFRVGNALILGGAVAAATIGSSIFWAARTEEVKLVHRIIIALAFALLQASITISHSLQNNLFVRQTNPAYLAGALAILHLCGRILTAIFSYIISTHNFNTLLLFFIPSLSLCAMVSCLIYWIKQNQKFSSASAV